MPSLLRTCALPLLLGLAALASGPGTAHAANWHIAVKKTGPTTVDLTFDAEPGQQYMICWKVESAPGDVCGYSGHKTDVNVYTPTSGLSNSNYANGRKTVHLHSITCGVDMKVRIRRTFVALDTYIFKIPC